RPRVEDAGEAAKKRNAAGNLVLALYRIVKACLLYSDTNQAVISMIPATQATVRGFCGLFEVEAANLIFTEKVVLVNRRVLKGSRETLGIGLELGAILGRCGITELSISRDAAVDAVASFARIVASAQRDASAAARLLEGEVPGIGARKLD